MRATDPFAPPTNGAPSFHDYPGASGGYYPRLQYPATQTPIPGRRVTLNALLRYRWTTLALFLGLALPGALFAWFSHKPMYRSFATLEVPPIKDEILERRQNNAMIPLYKAYLATRANELRSPDVLNCVLDTPEVKNTRWFRERSTSLFGARLSNMERLRDALQVKPQNEANFIQISIETANPVDCVTIVNAVQTEYLSWAQRQQTDTNEEINKTRDEKLDSAKREMDKLEQKMNDKRKELGIADPTAKLSVVAEQYGAAEDQLRATQTELADLQNEIAELVRLRDGAATSQATSQAASQSTRPEPSDAAMVRYRSSLKWQQLDTTLRQQRSNLESLKARFGPAAPKIADAERDVAMTEQMLRDEEQWIDKIAAQGLSPTSADDPLGRDLQSAELRRRLAEAKIVRLKDQLARMHEDNRGVVEGVQGLRGLEREYEAAKGLFDMLLATKTNKEMDQLIPFAANTRISEPFKPTTPSNGNRRFLLIGVAAFASALCSLGVTFLRAWMNPQVRETTDVLDATRGPMLGFVPLIPDLKKATPDQLAIQAEHFRMLRTALLERLPIERGSVLLITSAGPGAGKSTVSEKLSNVFAQCGKRVLVIDADLRRQTLTTRLGVRPAPGLLELLQKTATEAEAILTRGTGEPFVLPAGQLLNAQSTEVLVGRAFRDFLQRMREKFDIVLLDAPPLLPVADARIMAQAADGALLIVREGHCRRHEVTHAMHLLSNATRRFLGTVFLGANRGSNYPSNYGAYYGGYGYTNPRPSGRDEIVATRRSGNRFQS